VQETPKPWPSSETAAQFKSRPGGRTLASFSDSRHFKHGNTTTQTQTVVVQDSLAPTITACPPNQSANATSPTGAVVNYPAATASDNCAPPTLIYSQAAGTLFPVGDTTVTVTATDAVGHQVTRTFNVYVKGATEQLSILVTCNVTSRKQRLVFRR
jgi:hypothetical protein